MSAIDTLPVAIGAALAAGVATYSLGHIIEVRRRLREQVATARLKSVRHFMITSSARQVGPNVWEINVRHERHVITELVEGKDKALSRIDELVSALAQQVAREQPDPKEQPDE